MDDRREDVGGATEGWADWAANTVVLARAILHCASCGLAKAEFLNAVSQALMNHIGCDAVEIRLSNGKLHYRWEAAYRPHPVARLEVANWTRGTDGTMVPASGDRTDLEWMCRAVACLQFGPEQAAFTSNGSFWTGDAWERRSLTASAAGSEPVTLCLGGHYRSLAVIRFIVDDATIGLLHVKSEQPGCFTREDVESFEGIAQSLGLAIADWRAQQALRERIKELTCLYGIAQVAERADTSLPERLQLAAELLPAAWQYPEIAVARIVVDDRPYATAGFQLCRHRQSADIVVNGRRRGGVDVCYIEERPEFAAGAFLEEEAKLIVAVAREVALIVERHDADRERSHLQRQLIHADRLATIGQLAAGVAHELNEPLGSILGFAQLAQKSPGLPAPAARDIEKIVTGALYTREVIKKLMVFARQMPARKIPVDLNRVVEDSLYFLESRCTKAGARVVRELWPESPEIRGDPAQLTQVLVNLVVNAVQAMPDGGTLTVRTRLDGAVASLIVEDTGTGMSEEVVGKIFLPFFTTKDASEGTGLGLPVVHGIVSAHGGSIDVLSHPGRGTRFEIHLPASGTRQSQENDQNGNCGE